MNAASITCAEFGTEMCQLPPAPHERKTWDKRLPKCAYDPALTLQEWLLIIPGNPCGRNGTLENIITNRD